MFEKSNGLMRLDTVFKDAMSRFSEMSAVFQRMSGMQAFFENDNDFMNNLYENSVANFNELTRITHAFNPVIFFMPESASFSQDYKKKMDSFLKLMGLISIDEYQALIKKYDEIKKQSDDLEKIHHEQNKRIEELNKVASAEKKKTSSHNKAAEEAKNRLDEQKKIVSNLTKDLEIQKKNVLSLEKEVEKLQNLADSLKQQLSDKDQLPEKKAEKVKI